MCDVWCVCACVRVCVREREIFRKNEGRKEMFY